MTLYSSELKHFSLWFTITNGDALTPPRLTAQDVKDYIAHLQHDGYAVGTINKRIVAIRAYIKDAIERDEIDRDPLLNTKRIKLKYQTLAPKWLDRREQASLLRESERTINAANTPNRQRLAERNHAAIIFLMNSGLRISELMSVQPDDVETNDRSGRVTVSGKGNKQRIVPLNADAREAAKRLTFPLDISPRMFQIALGEIARRAALDDVTPHTLRHTFAKNLIDSDVSLEKVAALLGHSNINTTRIYTTPSEKDLQRAVEGLEV